jgi:hypothetical protein
MILVALLGNLDVSQDFKSLGGGHEGGDGWGVDYLTRSIWILAC